MIKEIDCAVKAMQDLCDLLSEDGLKNTERVRQEMDKIVSPEFEPYFSSNAALHMLAECERCGMCCRDENTIAVSIDDCRRIARHLGLTQKRFIMEYTRAHDLKADLVGSARMLRKEAYKPCPFFDPALPGCLIHFVKPQVCRAAFYLSKMNLLICEEQKNIRAIPGCPADARLRERIAEQCRLLDRQPRAMQELEALFSSERRDVELFRLLLRLKGLEIYFGGGTAALLARRLGLMRLPEDGEMKPALWLYAAVMRDLIL
jgi:Fe-S-cluster containining protein